jgi:hypothetical protein
MNPCFRESKASEIASPYLFKYWNAQLIFEPNLMHSLSRTAKYLKGKFI